MERNESGQIISDHARVEQLTLTCPIDSLSSSLKVPSLVEFVTYTLFSVAARGRRTGRRMMPYRTSIDKTVTLIKGMIIKFYSLSESSYVYNKQGNHEINYIIKGPIHDKIIDWEMIM